MWSWLCCRKDANQQQQQRRSRKVPNGIVSAKKRAQAQQVMIQSKNKQLSIHKQQSVKEIVQKKDTYVGQQMNGVPHGTGTKNYVNGDYYKGQWVNGVKEGKGEHYYFQLRTIYNGEWKHDMKNGNGHETEANGSWFEGEFKDGVRHGKGTYFDKQLNAKYSELYVNGSLKQRKQIGGQQLMQQDEFPTLKLDKERFNTADLIGFQQKNPQIKELDLDFLLKYYGLRKIISLQFIDTPISQWTIKQVHSFLQGVGLQQYKSIFYDNKIKGKDLASLDEDQMKQDLKMRLGDRKILKNYIEYLSSLTKTKKKDSKKQEEEKKRRQSLSVKKKKQSLLNTFTRSIEHQIIQEDDQWNEGYSEDQSKNKQLVEPSQKRKNQYQTQNWDKFMSRDNIGVLNYHSQNEMQMPQDNKDSDKTQRGSNQDHNKQVQMSPAIKRKHSEDKQFVLNPNSEGQSPTNPKYEKKQRSSTSSQSSEPNKNDQQEQLFKIKRKKTSFVSGPSQEIRQLYQFLRQNQSLDFIIKQKDIEIIEVIGEGGYGKVSRGRYMQCPVAVKDYMKAGRSHKSREQFMKEVHILSDLKHPNIVLYMGLCITVNRYQLVTQFMENGSLYDQLHIKKIKFTKEQQLQVIDDIVQGMVYLHNMKNMLHRDLKSSNVLIAEDYKVKLCDFGLSGHKNKNKKQKKNRIGTYQWMAPEVIRNQELDFFSDVYSFGVILWEILTQQIPYSGMSQTQIIGDVGYDKNHRLPNPPKGSDQFIISIMHKCLQRDPTERPTFIQIQRLIKEERKNRPYVKDVWNIL